MVFVQRATDKKVYFVAQNIFQNKEEYFKQDGDSFAITYENYLNKVIYEYIIYF